MPRLTALQQEGNYRRDFAAFSRHDKDAFLRALLIWHVRHCRRFDAPHIKAIQRLMEIMSKPLLKK